MFNFSTVTMEKIIISKYFEFIFVGRILSYFKIIYKGYHLIEGIFDLGSVYCSV
jgi:hypothetical protein